MATPPPPPGSPLWWVSRLEAALKERNGRIAVYDDYYEGRHPLAFASDKFRTSFGGLFQEFADNWCELVPSAVEERINVQGFRIGDKQEGDKDAWRIWQTNLLDASSQLAHMEALVREEASVIVWSNPADEQNPLITVEDPSQVVVEMVPGSQRMRAAALKVWHDDVDSAQLATLYLPDGVYKFRAVTSGDTALWVPGWVESSRWVPRETTGEPWPLPNPLGVVPVVPLVNRPRLLKPGASEIRQVIPVQDGVNKLIADLLIGSEFGAFRQRWVTGFEIPRDPDTNQPIEPFRAAVDRLFIAENPDARFGEMSETNLQNIVTAIEMLIQHIASQTRVPPHYFYLKGQFPSGESIRAAEASLVTKVRRKMRFFGEAWEEVMRLAFAVLDDKRAKVMDSETIWADPETRTESQHIDALTKLLAIGVPVQQLWEDAGYSPTQIERFIEMQKQLPPPQFKDVLQRRTLEQADQPGVPDLAVSSPPPGVPAGAQ